MWLWEKWGRPDNWQKRISVEEETVMNEYFQIGMPQISTSQFYTHLCPNFKLPLIWNFGLQSCDLNPLLPWVHLCFKFEKRLGEERDWILRVKARSTLETTSLVVPYPCHGFKPVHLPWYFPLFRCKPVWPNRSDIRKHRSSWKCQRHNKKPKKTCLPLYSPSRSHPSPSHLSPEVKSNVSFSIAPLSFRLSKEETESSAVLAMSKVLRPSSFLVFLLSSSLALLPRFAKPLSASKSQTFESQTAAAGAAAVAAAVENEGKARGGEGGRKKDGRRRRRRKRRRWKNRRRKKHFNFGLRKGKNRFWGGERASYTFR